MSSLSYNTYGKHKVRVLKVLPQEDGSQKVNEITADVLLTGDFAESYLTEDNKSVVPTDTVKNTITALAYDKLKTCRTSFAEDIAEHFLGKYDHVSGLTVEIRERRWERMVIDGKPHPHSFTHDANGTWFCTGTFERGTPGKLTAGVRDHLVMKTTGSGFVGYNMCDYTTLEETTDRFFSTYLSMEWEFNEDATKHSSIDQPILQEAHRIFAETYSPSVQRTLYQIGEAALEVAPTIKQISFSMPNVHFLPLDLSKLNRDNKNNTVVLPTDEPHGQIVGTVTR